MLNQQFIQVDTPFNIILRGARKTAGNKIAEQGSATIWRSSISVKNCMMITDYLYCMYIQYCRSMAEIKRVVPYQNLRQRPAGGGFMSEAD